jgi:dihydroneopterin aldolase
LNIAVVKLGGSTFHERAMDAWLGALSGAAKPLVLVPGGGPFADKVREEQMRIGFSDRAAHAMALLAMEQCGQIVIDRHRGFVATESLEDIKRALVARESVPVWMPAALALSATDIEHSWAVTSDALAAWLAGRIGAGTLLLLKQTDDFDASDDLAGLTRRGVLDDAFAAMLPSPVEVRLAGPRHLQDAANLLAAGSLPGIAIRASAMREAG